MALGTLTFNSLNLGNAAKALLCHEAPTAQTSCKVRP